MGWFDFGSKTINESVTEKLSKIATNSITKNISKCAIKYPCEGLVKLKS